MRQRDRSWNRCNEADRLTSVIDGKRRRMQGAAQIAEDMNKGIHLKWQPLDRTSSTYCKQHEKLPQRGGADRRADSAVSGADLDDCTVDCALVMGVLL